MLLDVKNNIQNQSRGLLDWKFFSHVSFRLEKKISSNQFSKHDWKTFSLKALENDFETDFYRTEMSYKSMKLTYMGLNLSYIGLNIVK